MWLKFAVTSAKVRVEGVELLNCKHFSFFIILLGNDHTVELNHKK